MPGRLIVKGRWKNAKRDGSMNRLESSYAEQLQALKLSGEIVDFLFECIKLRLADRTYLTPDFSVLMPDGFLEFHDVKGSFFPEHNRVKWKVAIEQFPWFTFVLVTRRRVADPWKLERF